MIFLNYNNYGVLQNSDKSDVITKNSYRVNSVFVAFSSLITNIATATSNYTCYATFVRNDDESINDLVMSPSTYTYGGTTYVGYFLLFTSKQITAVAGQLDLSIRLIRNSDNAEVVSASEPLVVADNGTTSDTTTSISTAQYEALTQVISNLNQPITILPESYNSIDEDNLVLNQLHNESRATGWYIKLDDSTLYYYNSDLDADSFAIGYNGLKSYLWDNTNENHVLSNDIDKVGVLANLVTTDKSSLVNALNETYQLYVNFNTNVDDRINGKADKTYVDTELAKKADKSTTYTKSEVYTKTEVDTELNKKADKVDTYTKSETYTKNEVDASLLLKADESDLNSVEALIPNDASSSNQLTTRDFVNSSIATNTATFRGTYDSLTLLKQATGDANDYAILRVDDGNGNVRYDRYKWVETEVDNSHWIFEYTLNNSSFTEEQYQALNSGITATKLAQILSDLEAVYTKTESNTLFYTKTYIDSLIANYSTTSDIATTYCTKAKQKADSDKSLYNLGAYDSVSTANGITTIIRQTGYVDLGKLDYDYNSSLQCFTSQKELENAITTYNESNIITKSTIYSQVSSFDSNTPNLSMYINTQLKLYLKNTTYNNASAFKSAMQGVMLQYKLATSYQEQVIENQPLNTLDQAQSQIVREEVESGRNILELVDKPSTTTNGVTYSISNGKITLNGTTTNAYNEISIIDFNVNNTSNCSINLFNNFNTTGRVVIDDITSSTNIVNIYLDSGYNLTFTNFTLYSSHTYRLKFIINNASVVLSNATLSPMLVKGSTPPMAYSPYNANKHITNAQAELLKDEYLKSSNLLNIEDKALTTTNGITYLITNGVIKNINGTSTASFASNILLQDITNVLELNQHYIFKRWIDNATNIRAQIILTKNDSTKTYIFNEQGFDFTSDLTSVEIQVVNDTTATITNGIVKPMLVKGTTIPTTFEPYHGEIVHKKELNAVENKIVKLYAHDVRLKLSIVYNNFDFGDADTSFTYRVITRFATPFANIGSLITSASDGEILSISLLETENEAVLKAYPLSISLNDSDAGSWIVCMIDDTAKALSIDKNFSFISDTVTEL